ncbi:MAG TPA: WYL domain-containing protein [Flavobacteriaceae bacterium]|nr:WYL domain-containing protein [Flavobacteriaceae bacterium]
MANIKHAHLRYNILDRCFRRIHQPFTFQELLEEVNAKIQEYYPDESIKTRTLREDISLFRNPESGFDAPLLTKTHKGKSVYCYEDPEFSIAQRGLLPDEEYLLETAQQLLERFENDPQYDKLSEALVLFQDEAQAKADTGYGQLLFSDKNEAYAGLGFLKPIFLAIKNKVVLKISYQGFHDTEAKEYIFHPYVLKQYNQRWFVFGYNESRAIEKWSIPLDARLKHFEELPEKSFKEDQTDWPQFFRNMVGVRNLSLTNEEARPETVVLRFNPKRIDYFKTKPIHPFWDEFLEEGKENQVFFETVINPELIQQILSYGKDVEVLAPEGLRELVKRQTVKLFEMYK